MKRIIYLSFFLHSLSFLAQESKSITINWEKGLNHLKQSIYTSEKVYNNEDNIPLYTEKISINNNNQLQDISFKINDEQVIGLADVTFYHKEKLPASPNFKLDLVNERGKYFGVISFNPIYLKNGQFVKVNSCTVNYSATVMSKKTLNKKSNVTQHSVLNSGRWYKIAISKSGVYKLDKTFFKSLGIDVATVNPKNIRVYGNGGGVLSEDPGHAQLDDLTENDIYVAGENDGVFNNEDFVLFYGKGPVNIKYHSESNIVHTQNVYDNFAYYFVNVDLGQGRRIQTNAFVDTTPDQELTEFTDFQIIEKDLHNYGLLGRTWFGDELNSGEDTVFSFNFPNIVTSKPMYVDAEVGSVSTTASEINVDYEGNSIIFDEIGPKEVIFILL